MKSSNEHILLYGISSASKTIAYCSLLESLSFPYSVIPVDQAGMQVGTLLDLPGFDAKNPGSEQEDSHGSTSAFAPGEMMILHGLSELRLNTLLKSIRSTGLEPIALKAVVTETNQHWTLKQLYGHLLLEHMQMHQGFGSRP